MPELSELVNNDLISKLSKLNNRQSSLDLIKKIYSEIMANSNNDAALESCISKIYNRLSGKENLTMEESQFVIQKNKYGSDVGLFSFFFLNMIELKSKQAIFTDSGTPHAYIKGNIVECMANSDNVIRAGLTSKFKDVGTLLEILNYSFDTYKIINEDRNIDEVYFKTTADEFEVSLFEKNENYIEDRKSNDKPSVFLIMEGSLELSWNNANDEHKIEFFKGNALFIPAALTNYKIRAVSSAKYFVVEIPSN